MNAISRRAHNEREYSENYPRAVKHGKHKPEKRENKRHSVEFSLCQIFAVFRSESRVLFGAERPVVCGLFRAVFREKYARRIVLTGIVRRNRRRDFELFRSVRRSGFFRRFRLFRFLVIRGNFYFRNILHFVHFELFRVIVIGGIDLAEFILFQIVHI